MKVSLAALSTILIASTSTSLVPAFAQNRDGGAGARFQYAKNLWKIEEPRIPKENYVMGGRPQRSAMEGKTPQGPSFLVGDPQFLAKPIPQPVSRTQVAMRPSAVPPQNLNHPFSPSFGAPTAPPPEMAHPQALEKFGSPAATPKTGVPAGLPQNGNSKAVAGKLVPGKTYAANRAVSGKLYHKHPAGQSANPALALTKPVETYGKNFGYTPGIVLPVASSNSGRYSRADVLGRVLSHHK